MRRFSTGLICLLFLFSMVCFPAEALVWPNELTANEAALKTYIEKVNTAL